MLTASLYCHGWLDRLLREVILPFWRSTQAALPQALFWVLRYARGGQHLKVRFHLPSEAHETAASRLQRAVETFFAALPDSPAAERDAADYLPPIDPEDLASGLRPDRSLVWTRYRYLPELVGAEPLSAAPGFETVFVRCLAASTEVTLEWLEALGGGEIPKARRMSLALQLLLTAAGGVHPQAEARARYLGFQRDWLLRVSPDREGALELLERKVGAQAAQRRALGPIAASASAPEGALGAWSRAVGDLASFCLEQGADEDLVYFALSRVIHNALNPAAIGTFNEAYLCHLLEAALVRHEEAMGS